MTEFETHTLDVPGAVVAYDVRRVEGSSEPPLLLFGSPMDATGFAALAVHFTDRTVVTYDPRGAGRSTKKVPGSESTPEQHADDVHRIIEELGGGPVDILASSGGAVNALALVARHPQQVRTLVAHEPPVSTAVPDREEALAAMKDLHTTYQRDGFGPAMAKFIALVGFKGPFPADYADRPGPAPSDFGLPTQDDGSRDDVLLGQNLLTCSHYEPDYDALRNGPTRVVLAVGVESEGELANRAAHAVAEKLGTKAVAFPSHHAGFLGPNDYGMAGEPEAFAATLRRVLSE
ncbi:alpha/beta fold hydrolase [Allorhizocola rhizosphaerae]|uniref:alpha/beta fold hydrolase n=1 Tax=Allorhizocola rhizosphaerae TaxID=1872709 RepID=UPI000E3C3553|nr:alpha/beta hydrolase [Allorhizocola rhizosphaerae]